jgi:hypothetical protein
MRDLVRLQLYAGPRTNQEEVQLKSAKHRIPYTTPHFYRLMPGSLSLSLSPYLYIYVYTGPGQAQALTSIGIGRDGGRVVI